MNNKTTTVGKLEQTVSVPDSEYIRLCEIQDAMSYVRHVYDAFKTDIEQGYKTKDKTFATDLLGAALRKFSEKVAAGGEESFGDKDCTKCGGRGYTNHGRHEFPGAHANPHHAHLCSCAEEGLARAMQAATQKQEQTMSVSEGEIWSFLRGVMLAGARIETSPSVNAESRSARIDACASDYANQLLAMISAAQKSEQQTANDSDDDGWERNAKYILDRCPYSVRVREGGGPECLLSSLVLTFQGMQHRLKELSQTEKSAPAVSVPEGWQLAPTKATKEMIDRGNRAINDVYWSVVDVYEAMLDEAQKTRQVASAAPLETAKLERQK